MTLVLYHIASFFVLLLLRVGFRHFHASTNHDSGGIAATRIKRLATKYSLVRLQDSLSVSRAFWPDSMPCVQPAVLAWGGPRSLADARVNCHRVVVIFTSSSLRRVFS